MENVLNGQVYKNVSQTGGYSEMIKNLSQGELNTTYLIKEINTNDAELEGFLFTLGCYAGEEITIISKLAENYVISVKDARYSIDEELAQAIVI